LFNTVETNAFKQQRLSSGDYIAHATYICQGEEQRLNLERLSPLPNAARNYYDSLVTQAKTLKRSG
jgi:hypothetical protein